MDSTSLSPGAAVTGAPAKRRTATVLPPAPPLRELARARSPPTHPPPVRKVAQPRFAALSPPPRTRRRGECARASSRIQRHAAAHRAGACACARTAWSRGGVGGALRGGKEREVRTASTLSFSTAACSVPQPTPPLQHMFARTCTSSPPGTGASAVAASAAAWAQRRAPPARRAPGTQGLVRARRCAAAGGEGKGAARRARCVCAMGGGG